MSSKESIRSKKKLLEDLWRNTYKKENIITTPRISEEEFRKQFNPDTYDWENKSKGDDDGNRIK